MRLRQGRMDDVTVYSDDPVAVAGRWVEAGARRLHLVDLDGALDGKPVNAPIIEAIMARYPDLPVQVGGGIRDEETVDAYLNAGAQYVIIGTRAVNTPHFVRDLCLEYPGHIIVGLDAKDGKLATDGWSKLSHQKVEDCAEHCERDGVASIIYTDISRDGMQQGVNAASTAKLARGINVPVFASGGVSSLDDIRALCEVSRDGVSGAIIGRALYDGTLDLAEAQALADELTQVIS